MDSITVLFYLCSYSLTGSANIEQIQLAATESLLRVGGVQGVGRQR